ncbi:MAG: exosome complex protein Rrp42 [Nanobdellota archaeon]
MTKENYENLRKHVLNYLENGIRYDGRKKEQFRDVSVEYGISKTAEGSATVTIGETKVMAGVKMAVEAPFPDTPDEGVLMVNAELLPMSNPEFEAGPPDIRAIELARVVDRGIRESGAVDTKKLCIEEGQKVWAIMVDVCTINDEGNLLDCAGLAAISALKDAKFPKYENGKVDYKQKTDKSIELAKHPVPVTVYKVGGHYVVDPLIDEELATDARLTVTSLEDGNLCALQKGGDDSLNHEDVNKMVSLALERSKEIREK